MKIMIHTCHARRRYVYDELIPSMKAQGIRDDEICVWLDWTGEGNLRSCMDSFRACGLTPGGTWHLQDDVLLSRRFAELARAHDTGVVCGFCNADFGPSATEKGVVPTVFMWNSFQCIRIPNELAHECAEWFFTDAVNRPGEYQRYVAEKKYDDTFWRDFMRERHADMRVVNLVPNIVDHVDYLIGGSVINRGRRKLLYRAEYWEDEDLTEALAERYKTK